MASSSLPDVVEFALALLASGALAGLLAGLFGASGGLVIVPVLHPLFSTLGMHNSIVVHLAAAISLGLVVLTGGRALLHHRHAEAAQKDAWLWPIPAGAVAASVVIAALPGQEVEIVFAVLVFAGALKMLFLGSKRTFAPAGGALVLPGTMNAGFFGFDARGLRRMAARILGVFRWGGRSPVVICALLAIPGAVGLAMTAFGEPRLPAGVMGYLNAMGVVVILVTSTLLAPVGAELSGQFPKRVLEVSFGAFLLLVTCEFAFSLLN